ncbi:FRG domain-containing protein [Luteimonas vadosa]|uniref:FRG domain-containing protein n=2 Tax=Luteimonas vadosa TaxID=1165507 RepID=A0ABP9E2P9_9GAMM
MAKTPRWKQVSYADGFMHIRLSSWKYFHDYIRQEFLDFPNYVWRGQRDAIWPLETSLDRALRGTPVSGRPALVRRHFGKFKLASRGRRGSNPQKIESENEWWAIAQHNGMATPLLDWTESPFVALYFAFHKDTSPASGERAVWALGGGEITKINRRIKASHTGDDPPILEYIRPSQDENARLVAQGGLFTKTPLQITVDKWVTSNFTSTSGEACLVKISIPTADRPQCLRTLNRMNINHLSLFPDLFGAGAHCNAALQIKGY